MTSLSVRPVRALKCQTPKRPWLTGLTLKSTVALLLSFATADAKSIKVAVNTWPPAMGNPYSQQIQGAVHPFVGLFDGLTFMDQDGRTLPRLAVSWTADSPTVWTFKLRPGVSFSNGEPFNAAAVVAMIEMLKAPEGQRFFYAQEVENIVSVKAVDDLTVVITTAKPDVILPKRLSLLTPTPPKYWRDVGPDGFTQKPIGTGPFTIDSWGRDRGKYVMEATDTSWRPSKHLRRIEFRILQEAPRRVQALEIGEIDLTYSIGYEDMKPLDAAGFRIVVNRIPTALAIALPNTHPNSPLNDVRVRKALNMAVDRDTIATQLLLGTVKPSAHGIEKGVFGYNPEIAAYPYDPARAKALLTEAGYGDGFSINAAVLAIATTDGAAIFQRVAQDLAAVGVKLNMRSVLGTEWVQMWTSGDWKGADALSSNWNGASYMDAGRAVESYTCARPGPFFCAPEVEKLLAQSNVEFDEAKREKQLQQALALLHDLAPSIYLFPQTEIMALSKDVLNTPFRGRFLDWGEVDVAEAP